MSMDAFWSGKLPIKHFVWGSAGGRDGHLRAVTTDIQLTIDEKPLILLIAQLTQILNNGHFFLFLSFIICFICFKDNLLFILDQRKRKR